MTDPERLGWPAHLVGELDHRRLRTPSVKLRSARTDAGGDCAIYCVDLRVRRPNADEYLTATELHSVEHFLLEGFSRLLPEHFVSVGLMGCQTGFYLVFRGEGHTEVLLPVLERILQEMQQAEAVPYASIEQCGNWRNHNLADAQRVAREILARRADWLDAAA
ncbi:MAG TPA: S-ribosylhomocysteine lyase [Ottowia sp.]|uniref:S-ribosylhomocysteine lyase n=1 Tax=Ottowia sp. TaxID=1898956 RepID=UPI002CD38C4F|nr:S-ribosylhomocysteine lyase [Ottowia sp.]HMN21066.1 S-ribosylhomocysteine lyase [Ottowia sp.]